MCDGEIRVLRDRADGPVRHVPTHVWHSWKCYAVCARVVARRSLDGRVPVSSVVASGPVRSCAP